MSGSPIVLNVEASTGVGCQELIDTFIRDAMVRLPGAVEEVVKNEIRRTLREFFQMSSAWRCMEGPYTVKEGLSEYLLNPVNSYTQMVYVIAAYLDGRELTPFNRPIVAEAVGTPMYYYCTTPENLFLYPTPEKDYERSLKVYLSLTPDSCTEKLPKMAITQFYDYILDGILYRMYIQPSKPYTDGSLALHHQRMYRYGIGKARIIAESGYMMQSSATEFPPFA